MGKQPMAEAPQHALDDDELKGAIMADLSEIAKKYRGEAKWKEVEEPGKKCKECMKEAMDYLMGKKELEGYKFFVKATLVQVNGYAQCATTYWSPDGRDLSVNEVNKENVMMILTSYAS